MLVIVIGSGPWLGGRRPPPCHWLLESTLEDNHLIDIRRHVRCDRLLVENGAVVGVAGQAHPLIFLIPAYRRASRLVGIYPSRFNANLMGRMLKKPR